MGYTLDAQYEVNVIVIAWHADFNLQSELPVMDEELIAALDTMPDGATLILDATRAKLGIKDAIFGANHAAHGSVIAKYPGLKVIIVSSNSFVELSTKGMNSSAFGNRDITVMPTLEDALAHVGAAPVLIPGD